MPAITITDLHLRRTAAPETGRLEIFDDKVPGFTLRITSKDARSWSVRYRGPDGNDRRLTLGTVQAIKSVAKARDLARDVLEAVRRGDDPQQQKRQRRAEAAVPQSSTPTVRALADDFLDTWVRRRNRPASIRAQEYNLKLACAEWGDWSITAVSRKHVIDLLDKTAARAPIGANTLRRGLSTFFAWCLEREHIALNPVAGTKPPTQEQERTRVLSHDELRWFWAATAKLSTDPRLGLYPYGSAFRLMLLTAQRRGEVAGLRYPELSRDRRTWSLPAERAKNKHAHQIPLSDAARAIIADCPRFKDSLFVFTVDGESPIPALGRRLDIVKVEVQRLRDLDYPDEPGTVERFTLHDLRRTCASEMARLGVDPHVIERVLNHQGGVISGVAAVYNRHGYDAEAAAALQLWADELARIVGEPDRGNVVPIRAAS